MRALTLRGWVLVVSVSIVTMAVTLFTLLQVRHWLQDEAQLHQIVELIQQGRIQVTAGPPPAAPPPVPARPQDPPK